MAISIPERPILNLHSITGFMPVGYMSTPWAVRVLPWRLSAACDRFGLRDSALLFDVCVHIFQERPVKFPTFMQRGVVSQKFPALPPGETQPRGVLSGGVHVLVVRIHGGYLRQI